MSYFPTIREVDHRRFQQDPDPEVDLAYRHAGFVVPEFEIRNNTGDTEEFDHNVLRAIHHNIVAGAAKLKIMRPLKLTLSLYGSVDGRLMDLEQLPYTNKDGIAHAGLDTVRDRLLDPIGVTAINRKLWTTVLPLSEDYEQIKLASRPNFFLRAIDSRYPLRRLSAPNPALNVLLRNPAQKIATELANEFPIVELIDEFGENS